MFRVIITRGIIICIALFEAAKAVGKGSDVALALLSPR